MNKSGRLEYWALFAVLAAFCGYFAVRVWDIDFWWHIATGREILRSAAIPHADPFGMYDAANACGQTVLRSEWLGQVLLYAVYDWLGLDGVIALRAGVLSLCLAIVYWRSRLIASSSVFALFMTALSGLAILHHTGERPQLFSFLLLAFQFLLLDAYVRFGRSWQLYVIPLLILLWINTHAGALVGVAVLAVFAAGYMVEKRREEGGWNSARNRLLAAVTGLCGLMLLLAPSGLDTFRCIVSQQSGIIRETVSEYASPWSLWPTTLYFWMFFGATLLSLPGLPGRDHIKQWGVILVLGVLSLISYRYIPMFVLVVAPYVAFGMSRMLGRYRLSDTVIHLSAIIAALIAIGYGYLQGTIFQRGFQETRFPAGAVTYLKDHDLGGKMFNSMNWGGYLLWNLRDSVRLFIDGRTLDPYRVAPYTNILWATPEGLRYFEKANFDLVLVPYGNVFTGERYPINAYLENDPAWRLVYQDKLGNLFVRQDRLSGMHGRQLNGEMQ